jgi:hypothetical protein
MITGEYSGILSIRHHIVIAAKNFCSTLKPPTTSGCLTSSSKYVEE